MAGKGRILVVDDEMGIREECKRVLTAEGYEVNGAEDGETGLRMVKEQAYDLLLIDLMMPGIGGLDLIRAVHEFDPEIILIVITGYATIESAVEAMRRGAYDYIQKPFAPEVLRAAVSRGLEKRYLKMEAERRRADRDRRLLELANEKSGAKTIIGCMADGVLVTNRDGQLVLWNSAAANMLGLTDAHVPGKPLSHYLSSKAVLDLFQEVVEAKAQGFTVIRREVEVEEGGRVFMASIAPVRDERGEILGAVTVLSDVTELKESEKKKSQIVSTVAHELRSPLAAIEGWLDLVASDGETDPEQARQWILKAKERVHSLLELVNDLLIISRTEAGKVAQNMEPIDLSVLLRSVAESHSNQAKEADVDIELNIAGNLPPIRGDKKDLERLFGNLIDNAIKYNKPGGRVTIGANSREGFVCIAVADTGIGIAEENLGRIFEYFFRVEDDRTSKIRGTGLGLAIVKKILESHHGRIEVSSTLGEGTTFTVCLPVCESTKA